jgi:hypothetical protein
VARGLNVKSWTLYCRHVPRKKTSWQALLRPRVHVYLSLQSLQATGAQFFQVIDFNLTHSFNPSSPLNLPNPLCFAPPCGKLVSSCTLIELMCTAPVSICFAILKPRCKFSVNTADARPYSVSFAILIASSSDSTTNSDTVGPKDSV